MTPKKVAAVVNPASANGATARRWPEIARLLAQEGIDFDTYLGP